MDKMQLHDLTMLYLKNKDLTNKTPEEMVRIYLESYGKMSDEDYKINEENRPDLDEVLDSMSF